MYILLKQAFAGEKDFFLEIRIKDINDNTPKFSYCLRKHNKCQLNYNVSESLRVGSKLPIETLVATDDDLGLFFVLIYVALVVYEKKKII